MKNMKEIKKPRKGASKELWVQFYFTTLALCDALDIFSLTLVTHKIVFTFILCCLGYFHRFYENLSKEK